MDRSARSGSRPGAACAAAAAHPRRRLAWEIAGYLAVAVGLGALLLVRVSKVNGFYLDEWVYTAAARFLWEEAPFGVLDAIPQWTRGAQRLYSLLLATAWGPLDASTAYSVSHVINVVLLISGTWPAALFAHRMIDAPLLRVLAVALAVATPWTLISANLLTENLAFPVFLWCAYAILRAAEDPRLITQVVALAAVGALTLCRLNLAAMFAALVVAIAYAELVTRNGRPLAAWLVGVARRRALVLAATVLGAAFAVRVLTSQGASLGAYSVVTSGSFFDAVWGPRVDETGRAFMSSYRALATGSFIFPVVFGLATGLSAVAGRLERRAVLPGVVLLLASTAIVAVVSVWNGAFGVFEERYVMFGYAPLAILAVAGLERLPRLLPGLVAAGALVAAAVKLGTPAVGNNSGNFFAAPAQAFWGRVVEYRLQRTEENLLGWLPGAGGRWLLVALAILAAVVFAGVLRARAGRWLAAGLALCLVAQVAALNYDYGKLLYGTPEAPGGLAGSKNREQERDDWVDDALPPGARAAIAPGLATPSAPSGDTERQQFWNSSVDATVALRTVGAGVPAPAGYEVIESPLQGRLAGWKGPRYEWLVAQVDDPRVQFAGRLTARSAHAPFGLSRLTAPAKAVWTATGLQPDGAIVEGQAVTMTLDRGRVPAARAVTLRVRPPEAAPGRVAWTVHRAGRRVASGSGRAGATAQVRLRVAPCARGERCEPVSWRLDATGPATPVPLPDYGAPGPPRPVVLHFDAARLGAR